MPSAVQMVDIMSKTGVPLDPVYTLKGVRGMLGEVTNNPTVFSGKRILYIHTGEFTHNSTHSGTIGKPPQAIHYSLR